MVKRQLTVLWALRIFGPINGRELIRRTQLTRDTVAINMMVHVEEKYAVELKPGVWDITEEGRKVFEPKREPTAPEPPARDWRRKWRVIR